MAGKCKGTIEELLKYQNDSRTACKYGVKCYQKNLTHLNKYKHPPSKKRDSSEEQTNGPKKPKFETTNAKKIENVTTERKNEYISESDSEPDSSSNRGKDEPISDSSSSSREILCVQNSKVNCNSKHSNTNDSASELPMLNLTSSSPDIINKMIKELFLVEMPDDFFSFWEFCNSQAKLSKALATMCPTDALKTFGLVLVGPFDVIAGKFNGQAQAKDPLLYLTHWRYYYDPPEFQTILKGDDKTQFHMGYFRDEPNLHPVFVASNCAAKDGIITPVAENVFGAVNAFFEKSKQSSNPFQKIKISTVQKALQVWARDNNFNLDILTPSMRRRQGKVVSKTFHGAGIVVPVDSKTELGYRELMESDGKLKKILQLIVESSSDEERDCFLEKLQPIITAANIANDECDFGTSLELGIDLFSFGSDAVERTALQLLTTAYSLLSRPEFGQIIQAHLKHRQKGCYLSILNSKLKK